MNDLILMKCNCHVENSFPKLLLIQNSLIFLKLKKSFAKQQSFKKAAGTQISDDNPV